MPPSKHPRIILIALVLATVASGSSDLSNTKLSIRSELLEWTLAASAAAFTEFYFSKTPVWTAQPLLRTNSQKAYKTETVSDAWLFPLGFGMAGGIGLLPNSGGFVDKEAYVHAKGFIETSFAILPLVDEIVKHVAGKKRPDYDSGMVLYARGQNVDVNDLRKSFWSNQAAMSFGMATYFDLFLFRNVAGCDLRALLWKTPLSMATYAAATYISYTRVSDNVHEPIDVVAGGLAGAAISSCMYFLTEKRFGNGALGFEAAPGGARISTKF